MLLYCVRLLSTTGVDDQMKQEREVFRRLACIFKYGSRLFYRVTIVLTFANKVMPSAGTTVENSVEEYASRFRSMLIQFIDINMIAASLRFLELLIMFS